MSHVTAVLAATLLCAMFLGAELCAEDAETSSYVYTSFGLVAPVRGTNEFVAYGKRAGKWNSFTFPKGVEARPIAGSGVCVFDLRGEGITEFVAVDQDGNWCTVKLSAPVNSCQPFVGGNVAVIESGGKAYAFSAELGKWDVVDAPVSTQLLLNGLAIIAAPDSIAVFSSETGKWAVTKTSK
jgi:hypothetical protein